MSYRPRIGGKLREETSGVDRSQAGCKWWGLDPVKEIGQTCELNVIMRRLATSDRSVVTAAKLVYSTWKNPTPGERHGKAIYRNRFAPQSVHLLYAVGKRQDIPDEMEAGGSGAVCEEAADRRRSGGGDHGQHAAVPRRCGQACGAGGGGRQQPVPGDQPVGEEDRRQRRAAAGAVFIEGFVTGGAYEE